MKLRDAILAVMGRYALRSVADDYQLTVADRRSVEALRDAVAAAAEATSADLLCYLYEGEIKQVANAVGVDPKGRRKVVVARLLAAPAAGGKPNRATKQAKRKKAAPTATTVAAKGKKPKAPPRGDDYRHKEKSRARPDVGTQAQFKKKKPPVTYRYDSSLSPSLQWDGQNSARELGEWLLAQIDEASRLDPPHNFPQPRKFIGGDGQTLASVAGLNDAVEALKRLSRPFLNWAGKAERLSFDVPTLPLFVHERLSTKAIIETLTGHRRQKETQKTLFDLFGDPERPITDQVLKAYEYDDDWTNRLILGDSLVVMNSLLHYENLGGQVQMIYMDPPYGVKFGSNFQPFVRKRDVKHNDDESMTREPEMVQAYRDTWQVGIHSYLIGLRDRLLLSRDLLHPAGSLFVQIGDENFHHVCEVLDEVFGAENRVSIITFKKTTSASGKLLGTVSDYLLWYARDKERAKFRPLFAPRLGEGWVNYDYVRLPDGEHRKMTKNERSNWRRLPEGSRVYRRDNLTSQRPAQEGDVRSYDFEGKTYRPGKGTFKSDLKGLNSLREAQRLEAYGTTLAYRRFAGDFPYIPRNNLWDDTVTGGFVEDRYYVVQTTARVVERCILMTTDPGDLVLDPTCGSGTTAYVAEQWGRRWITGDVSRVPLALARQRLLTATFPWHELKDEDRGPAGGFVYRRKQNKKGEEVGGIVPHITLKSIANNQPPDEEVLVDRPEQVKNVTRVTGPFCFEATIPTPVDFDADGEEDSNAGAAEAHASFEDRMVEVLRKSPLLRLEGNRTVKLYGVRPPAKSLSLSAEATVEMNGGGASTNGGAAERKPVAFVFGPENGAVSEKLVYSAAREAHMKGYTHLYVIGFAIQPNARGLIDNSGDMVGLPATYVQATPDLMMGDLLKNMRSSQIFSVCGLPEVNVQRAEDDRWQVELIGLDVFDPVTMDNDSRPGRDVPAWFLDTDYNDLCFHVCQAFFPRTSAWDNLRKALKGTYEESVWDHLSGTTSAPFEAGENGKVAVKVIDDRGNELMVVKDLT